MRRLWCKLAGHAWGEWFEVSNSDGSINHYYHMCSRCRSTWLQIEKPEGFQ